MAGKKVTTRKNLSKRPLKIKTKFPVMIGMPVPMIDHKINDGVAGFITGAAARGIGLPQTVYSRQPEMARNIIINEFLTSEDCAHFTHLFFIDHDTVPVDQQSIEKLMVHRKPVVSAVTPLFWGKKMTFTWNVRMEKKDGKFHNIAINDLPEKLFKASAVGGTSMLIERQVLEKLKKPYQKTTWDKDYINFVKGEDYYFCEKIQEAGFDIWIDPTLQCHHFHTLDLLKQVGIMQNVHSAAIEALDAADAEIEKLKKELNRREKKSKIIIPKGKVDLDSLVQA